MAKAPEHLSDQDIERYRRRSMSPAELLSSDDHLASCDACSGRLHGEEDQRAMLASVVSAFRETAGAGSGHPGYESLAALVDGRLAEVDREILESHLEFCAQCAAELHDLRLVVEALAAAPVQAPTSPTLWKRFLAAWTMPAFRIPVQVAGAAAAAALLVWVAAPLLRQQDGDGAVAQRQQDNGRDRTAARLPEPAPVVALLDGGTRVTLDQQGKLTGLESVSAPLQESVKTALLHQQINTPLALRQLIGEPGRLMGGSEDTTSFRLLTPVGAVVEADRPTFRWRPLRGATSYTVTVYDSGFRQVAAGRLAAGRSLSATEWTTPGSLPRGRIYTWQVRTVLADQEVVSPSPAAPEAKFKVLEQAKVEELKSVRQTQSGSHLLMGVVYAEAGLLEEAERELQSLLEANPQSPVAGKLLASVKALRR